MRGWYMVAVAVAGLGLGCNKSPEGGTPKSDASFKLSLPGPASKDIKQGNTETYDASVDRGSGFKHDVKLSVDGKPENVSVKLNKDTIKASDGDTKFTITVTPDKGAKIGEHEIKVTGTPSNGAATSQTFKINVTENK